MFSCARILTQLSLLVATILLVACGAQPEPAAPAEPQQGEVAAEIEEVEPEKTREAEAEGHDEQEGAREAEASTVEGDHAHGEGHAHAEALEPIVAGLAPVNLAEGEQLQVVASTSIIGDLVANVAGDNVDLLVLIPIGSDLHTFEPMPSDLAAIAEADVIFVIGLNAEDTLMESLENAGGQAVIVPVSAGIESREFDEGDAHAHNEEEGHEHEAEKVADHAEESHEADAAMAKAGEHPEEVHSEEGHEHNGTDPHVWTTPYHAITMVHTIEATLAALDPAQAELYESNAETYEAELEALDAWVKSQIETIPAENRELVTDHAVFGYYADRYGLTQVGAVIPAFSTNAEPSAQELAELQDVVTEYNVSAIFVGTTVNPSLSEQVAQDTGKQLVTVYTGSLGPVGSGAETFIEYIEYNTNAIVEGLGQ